MEPGGRAIFAKLTVDYAASIVINAGEMSQFWLAGKGGKTGENLSRPRLAFPSIIYYPRLRNLPRLPALGIAAKQRTPPLSRYRGKFAESSLPCTDTALG